MMTAPFIDAFGRPAADPHPDDFCRWCHGRGTVLEYQGASLIAGRCLSCDGTGWAGMRFAPGPTDDERAAEYAAMEYAE